MDKTSLILPKHLFLDITYIEGRIQSDNSVGLLRFESMSLASQTVIYREKHPINVTENTLKEYLDILEIKEIGRDWKYCIDECILQPYFQHLHWHVTV